MTPIEKKQELMSVLQDYKRWLREGKPKYRKEQYYYDGYHNHIHQEENQDFFRFNIQIYDSPDGDTWWSGTFRPLNGDTDIEILSEDYQEIDL